jgi:hypothetical protein
MKTYKLSLLGGVALLATLFVGCGKDTFTPGEPENPNSKSVFFPAKQIAAVVELEPTDPTVFTFKAMRTKDTEAITVPVEVVSNDKEVFNVSPITFAAGQTETQFTVSFPNAEIGKAYNCVVKISDPGYYDIYESNPTFVTFTVERVKWNLLGTGTYSYNSWWKPDGDDVPEANRWNGKEVYELYQRDKTGIHRIPNWGMGSPVYLYFTVNPNDNTISVAKQLIGSTHPNYGPVSGTGAWGEYKPDTKTYSIMLEYTVAAGSFGTLGIDTFVLDTPVAP